MLRSKVLFTQLWSDGEREASTAIPLIRRAVLTPRYIVRYTHLVVHISGKLFTAPPLMDYIYNVEIDAVRLKRRVQMFQWTEEEEIIEGDMSPSIQASPPDTTYSYSTAWKDKVIDSGLFSVPFGHENPVSFPLNSEIQAAEVVKIGAYYLSPEIIEAFNSFEPFSGDEEPPAGDVKLHAGMYYHAKDIFNPHVGDIRVQFYYAGHAKDTTSFSLVRYTGMLTHPPLIKLRGGSMRPGIPPSIFNVPVSCLPSPKLTPRPAKVEDQQLRYFLQKDKITSFDACKPERNLQKQYKILIISRSKERVVYLFMTDNFSECNLSVIVENKLTLCSPLTLSAFKNGISVPLFKIHHPNNGLRSYPQFDETVRLAMHYDIPFYKTIQNVVTLLQSHTSACIDTEEEKKLVFLTRQLELLLQKQFSMNDYFFALQSYPRCNYEQLRDFLVLLCKRKLQYITSSIDKDLVQRETFDKVQTLQQKNVFLLVDEVQIRLNAEECSPSDLCEEDPYSVIGTLKGQVINPYLSSNGQELVLLQLGQHTPEEVLATHHAHTKFRNWSIRIIGFTIMCGAIAVLLPLVQVIVGSFSVLEDIRSMSEGHFAVTVALSLSLVVVALSWCVYKPVFALLLAFLAMMPAIKGSYYCGSGKPDPLKFKSTTQPRHH
ncbi:Transmembrane protein 43 family [Trinorchestia longiramus]|nr:Transmembrane protein 43 family [Trinorchestia longiramus]